MNRSARRDWLIGAGVATAAATLGAGWALWRNEDAPAPPASLWATSFDTPAGQRLVMADLRGQPLLLNFWATWCPPCVREMPVLDSFAREHRARGWHVVGLAADDATSVRAFLERSPVSFAIGVAGFAGIALSRELGNDGGGLPFSVLLARNGAVLRTRVGESTAEDLAQWAQLIE